MDRAVLFHDREAVLGDMKTGPSVPIMLVLGLAVGVGFQLVSGPLAGGLAHLASNINPGTRVRWVYIVMDATFLIIGLCACAVTAMRAQTIAWRTFWISAAAPLGFSLVRALMSLSDAFSTGGM